MLIFIVMEQKLIFNKEFVYMLGLIWADGYISKKTNAITLETNLIDSQEFLPVLNENYKFNFYSRERKNRKPQGIINISSKELSSIMKSSDYLSKSYMSPTKILSQIPTELINFFYLGYSDGDGCFYNNNTYNTIQHISTSTYEQDWSFMSNICDSIGVKYIIKKTINKKNNNKYSQFIIYRHECVIKYGDFLYENSPFGLKRKKDKFYNIKNTINSRPKFIIQCFKDSKLIKEFDSLKSASLWVNKSRNVSSDINDCIVGRQKTSLGFVWKKIQIN